MMQRRKLPEVVGMVLWVLGIGLVLFVAGYWLIALANRKHNRRIDGDPDLTTAGRIVNDQNGRTGERFRYGLYRARWNGCEAIALHNAKVLLGLPSSLSGAMTELQTVGAMFGFGFFGSDPFRLGWVLRRAGIRARRVRLGQMDDPGVYIIAYWNKGAPWKGAHTVAVSFDGAAYMRRNPYGGMVPSELGRRFICGYRLEKNMEE